MEKIDKEPDSSDRKVQSQRPFTEPYDSSFDFPESDLTYFGPVARTSSSPKTPESAK